MIVATAVPALRLNPALAKIERMAADAMKPAKGFLKTPKLAAKITTAVVTGHNFADVIAKTNNIRDKVSKATGIHTSVPVDQSKTPVKEMIKEADDARKQLDTAIEALDSEFAASVHSVLYKEPYQSKETLSKMAERLLPPLTYYTDDELEQLGRFFQWNILGQYAKRNVAIVTTTYSTGDSVGIDGLNDIQQEQIMEWFGPQSPWSRSSGRVPVVRDIWFALKLWNVEQRKASSGGSIFGYG